MKLSIIIPLYNVGDFVDTCLQSILNQSLDPSYFEVIVVNDGSTDNSASVVEKFVLKNKNFFMHHQENSGVGSARNKGISLAKGKYIYFIDPDDYLASNVLKPILDYIEAHNLQVLTFLSNKTTRRDLISSNFDTIENQPAHVLSGVDYLGEVKYNNEIWWYVIEKSFIEEIGLKFITGRWMEDAIFTAKLLLKAQRVGHLPIDGHRYVTVEGSAMTSKEAKHSIKVIYDQSNATEVFNELIADLKKSEPLKLASIDRLVERQQSFVFFMMVRILKSRITFSEVKEIMEKMIHIDAYPLDKFSKKDYQGVQYKILRSVFNIKYIYYTLFLILRPFLKRI